MSGDRRTHPVQSHEHSSFCILVRGLYLETKRNRTRTYFPSDVNRVSHLRYLGQANFDDRPHSVIRYADEDGLELSLYVDDKTGLVSKYEPLDTDSLAGDVMIETIFKGYRIENGRPVPSVRMTRRGGELTGEVKVLDVVFSAALAETGPSPTK